MNKTVGIIGLREAVPRLDEHGGVLSASISTPCTADKFGSGGTVAIGVAAVVRDTPIILTSLPSPEAVEKVAQEIAGSKQSSRIVAELSTLSLADKLRFGAILQQAGHIALDCPLSGTGAQAKLRDLVVYAGDSAAIAQCMGLFADFAKQSADLGQYGNGSKMKFIANHLVAINNVATAEAMLLAEQAD